MFFLMAAAVSLAPPNTSVRPCPACALRASSTRLMSANDEWSANDELNERIEQVKGEFVRLLALKDALVPRQRLRLTLPSSFLSVVERGSTLVTFGRYRRMHTHGVEVKAQQIMPRDDGRLDVVLLAGRVCELTQVGLAEDLASPWLGRDARVRWLEGLQEPTALTGRRSSRVVARSEALAALLSEWMDKVRRSGRERFDGQIDRILHDLGPMPAADEVTARCLYAAALINPEPPLRLANEVRPTVLMAQSDEERLDALEMGIADSIGRLEVDWI